MRWSAAGEVEAGEEGDGGTEESAGLETPMQDVDCEGCVGERLVFCIG